MIRLLLGPAFVLAILLSLLGVPGAGAEGVDPGTEPPALTVKKEPTVRGKPRYGQTLRATPGRWKPTPTKVRYQWLRDGKAIKGATKRRYVIKPGDVGDKIAVEVTARAPEHAATTVRVGVGRIKHRVDQRRVVRYSVRTKGKVSGVATFRRLAQQTYADARGWRGKGVRFVRVKKGGAFTLWLSQASLVPSFSSGCSAEWSCRVGRNVIINVLRWKHASPAWNKAGRSLRDYRHMVVNHETGHWLGYGHASCPRRGALAPVMMQQSKGRAGCRFNPWPTLGELHRGRVVHRAVHRAVPGVATGPAPYVIVD